MSATRGVSLALVHHANQYLITDGYDNREGVCDLAERYAAVLHLHRKYKIPVNLHLSGTLIETFAWHCPWFLALVRELRAAGLVGLIGGTYAENVMPLYPPAFNRRQLQEHLWLYSRHLQCPPAQVQICWVPERVWDTARLAPVLRSGRLANGGYRYVLLDDRLLYPTHGKYLGSPRALFDAAGPYGADGSYSAPIAGCGPQPTPPAGRPGPAETPGPCVIAGADGLVVLPLSANLRYWVPPWKPEHWRYLEGAVQAMAQGGGEDSLLLYADDLEKPAGAGPWWAGHRECYDAFLRWVASREDVTAVLLSDWLAAGRPPRGERPLEAGTFFELAQAWQAGEDYRGWWEDAAWSPYRRYLTATRHALRACRGAGGDRRLLRLAWKHLLASTYETAWHWPDTGAGGQVPTPWAQALASHARASLVMAAAARWFARGHEGPSVEVVDVDRDGEEEVVLRNEHLYAVLAPGCGGRLVYLFAHTPAGGVLVIGNPTDDWNWQQELNRYMDRPANHPGALADVGFEHDRYEVSGLGGAGGPAFLEMTNTQAGSPLGGARKSVLLVPGAPALLVGYRLPDGRQSLATEACLSPDYYRLLREGQKPHPYQQETWRGFRNGPVAVWLARAGDEATSWAEPARAEVGHGRNVRLRAHASPEAQRTLLMFHLLIGCGKTDEGRCQRLVRKGRDALGALRREAVSAAVYGA